MLVTVSDLPGETPIDIAERLDDAEWCLGQRRPVLGIRTAKLDPNGVPDAQLDRCALGRCGGAVLGLDGGRGLAHSDLTVDACPSLRGVDLERGLAPSPESTSAIFADAVSWASAAPNPAAT